jgi:predicted MFS family arabinose efflux permease
MEVGVAIAYSATFFFLGIAAVAGGWACERIGLFPLLILGTALLFAGEMMAAASGGLRMFVASRALVGMGVGLGHNCADVIAAAQKNPLDVERGFSMSNVGYNSGTNCGLVIGTAVGLLWGYRSVYLASALIAVLMLGYILMIFRGTGAPGAGEPIAELADARDAEGTGLAADAGGVELPGAGLAELADAGMAGGTGLADAGGVGMAVVADAVAPVAEGAGLSDASDVRRQRGAGVRFITSPRVLGFFLLALFPYMLCNAFTYYFLPLTGATYGLGEENISRIIFVYGMVSIYIGPALTRKLLEKFRVKAALGLGGLLIALALLLYAAAPVLGVLLASTAMFAVADSFSFTSQSLYFARLPETLDYGSGAALGVNNVISGLAQSLSSYCFAAAMVLGTRAGLGVIGLGMGILLMLFLVITRGERDFATVGRREGAEI